MDYISQKISKIFKLDYFVSMLKIDFDLKKIFGMLVALIVSYIILVPTYNLLCKYLFSKSSKSSVASNCSNSKSNRKYRKITSSECSGCKSSKSSKSSNSSKSTSINRRKLDNVLRKFKITE